MKQGDKNEAIKQMCGVYVVAIIMLLLWCAVG
jgi:hypothetical protein